MSCNPAGHFFYKKFFYNFQFKSGNVFVEFFLLTTFQTL